MKQLTLFAVAFTALFTFTACDSPEEKLESSFMDFHESFEELVTDPTSEHIEKAKDKYVDFLQEAKDYNVYYQTELEARRAEKEAEMEAKRAEREAEKYAAVPDGEGTARWYNPLSWF